MTANRFNFRFWDKKNNYMFTQSCNNHSQTKIKDFDYIFLDESEATLANTLRNESGYELEVAPKDRFIIMQSTGLEDKNGREVFEGDIIEYDRYKGYRPRYKVVFKGLGFNFIPLTPYEEEEIDVDDLDLKTFIIIGNIYENKDLLEK